MYLRPLYESPTVGFVKVYDPDTGLLVAATSIVVTVRLASNYNDSIAGTFTAEATDITGVYKIQVLETGDLTPGVHYYWRAVVTVETQVDVAIGEFALGPPNGGGVVATDAGNTTTTFKVAGFFADGATALGDSLANDGFNGSLISLHMGSYYGSQIRRVTDFVLSTGFITVDEALPTIPADGTPFNLVTF